MFLKSLTTVGSLTFLSRILGYVRELFIASVIGPGPLSDAFFLALKLPNLFRRLFAEGAFNSAFVPIFSRLYMEETLNETKRFINNSFSFLLIILTFLVVVFELFMPFVMDAVAPGFKSTPHKFDQVVSFARIMFPYILFISLAAMLSGILNTLNRFAAATAAPILLNVNAILALVLFSSYPLMAATALSWSIPLSGILQLVWVYMDVRRQGFEIQIRIPRLTPRIKELFSRMAPGIMGGGIFQINMLVADIIASFIPSGISYLAFADRINQFPLSIIGVAMGTVLLPLFARQMREANMDKGLNSQNRAIEMALFLSLPAATALFIMANPVIQVLYEHGRFTPEATRATALALMAFVTGLPAYVLIKVLSANFFARGDTKTPMIVGAIAILANLLLNLTLSHFWSYVGIALATALSSWVNMVILLGVLMKQKMVRSDKMLKMRLFKISISTSCMGIVLLYTQHLLKACTPLFCPEIGLLIQMAVGGGTYMLVATVLRSINLKDLSSSFDP